MQDLPALLKKYANNTCNEQERLLVETWLTTDPPHSATQWHTAEKEQDVKSQLWQDIHHATLGKRTAIRRQLIYFPAAACLLLAICLLIRYHPMLLSRKLTYSNQTGKTTQSFTVNGLQLNIQPNSTCTLEIPLFNNNIGTVQLCGAVALVNTSGHELKLLVNSETDCNTTGSDNVTLHKGQTYLAMTDQELNLLAATKDELLDGLPRSFSSRLSERFKL